MNQLKIVSSETRSNTTAACGVMQYFRLSIKLDCTCEIKQVPKLSLHVNPNDRSRSQPTRQRTLSSSIPLPRP